MGTSPDVLHRKINKVKELNAKNENLIKSPHMNDPTTNPCIKEENLARKCWLDNEGDADACKDHYENFKICNKFWNWVKWGRIRNQIYPGLPPPEERPTILKQKMNDFKEGKSGKTSFSENVISV